MALNKIKTIGILTSGDDSPGLNGRNIMPIPLNSVISTPPVTPMEYYEMARILAR